MATNKMSIAFLAGAEDGMSQATRPSITHFDSDSGLRKLPNVEHRGLRTPVSHISTPANGPAGSLAYARPTLQEPFLASDQDPVEEQVRQNKGDAVSTPSDSEDSGFGRFQRQPRPPRPV